MEEERHLARATIGRRLSTIVGFYRFAVIDGFMTESPAEHVRRPKIDTESTTLGLDRMELCAFLAQAAAARPVDHALACLLGLLGLRVSEAFRRRSDPTANGRLHSEAAPTSDVLLDGGRRAHITRRVSLAPDVQKSWSAQAFCSNYPQSRCATTAPLPGRDVQG